MCAITWLVKVLHLFRCEFNDIREVQWIVFCSMYFVKNAYAVYSTLYLKCTCSSSDKVRAYDNGIVLLMLSFSHFATCQQRTLSTFIILVKPSNVITPYTDS